MIWFDGEISTESRVPFDLRDRGLSLADGLFETVLVVGGVPFRLADHLARLRSGATVLRLAYDPQVVERAILELAQVAGPAGVVRVTVTRGTGPRGLRIPVAQQPLVFATAAPWLPAMAFQPQRLVTSTIRRNATSPLSRVKSLGYLDNILALEDAVAAGADDALLLSAQDAVACTSAANVFAVIGHELVTPPVMDGVLPGIMRSLLLAAATRLGRIGVERSLTPQMLREAEAVFATNSVRLISPIISLDGVPLRGGAIEDLKRFLRDAIARECGTPLATGP